MEFISIFDVLGPNMVGPSSSHTAGACSIALMARKMLGEPAARAEFVLYGSFARTYKGHGTDRTWRFSCNETETEVHPNTVDIDLTGITGKTVSMRGESVGGGKIRIARINEIDVDFSGECNTLIVVHKDRIGMAAHITSCLSQAEINIAFMRLFRESKGDKAYSIVEFDGKLPEHTKEKILLEQDVEHVMLIQIREG